MLLSRTHSQPPHKHVASPKSSSSSVLVLWEFFISCMNYLWQYKISNASGSMCCWSGCRGAFGPFISYRAVYPYTITHILSRLNLRRTTAVRFNTRRNSCNTRTRWWLRNIAVPLDDTGDTDSNSLYSDWLSCKRSFCGKKGFKWIIIRTPLHLYLASPRPVLSLCIVRRSSASSSFILCTTHLMSWRWCGAGRAVVADTRNY